MQSHNKPRVYYLMSIMIVTLLMPTAAVSTLAVEVGGITAVNSIEDHDLPRSTERVVNSPFFPGKVSIPSNQVPLSPDQIAIWDQVVYETFRDGNWEIYSVTNAEIITTRLTENAASDHSPKCSPGCQKIAFASDRSGVFQIYTMNGDGSGVTQITYGGVDNLSPDWSPDGLKIVFESDRDNQPATFTPDIYTMNSDGSGEMPLTDDPDFDGMPAWSPDGSKIAFVSRRTQFYNIFVMNRDGSQQTRLSDESYCENPRWSPDGTRIAYDADGDGDQWQELWMMNADGSHQHLFAEAPSIYGDLYASTWSPQGTYIVATFVAYIPIDGKLYFSFAEPIMWNADNPYGYGGFLSTNNAFFPDWVSKDITPPVSELLPIPQYSYHQMGVAWSAVDLGGSYIKDYDVQVRESSEGWTAWLDHTEYTGAGYDGQPGHTYCFRVRATDVAGNVGNWNNGGAGICTTLYQMSVMGIIQDNRELPIIGARIGITPTEFLNFPSNASGRYAAYDAEIGDYQFIWSKNGYLSLARFNEWGQDLIRDVTLPPINNIMQNWGFETGSMAPWVPGGDFWPVIYENGAHSGNYSCAIGGGTPKENAALGTADSLLSQAISIPADMNAPTLSFYWWLMGTTGESGPHFIVSVTHGGVSTVLMSTTDDSYYGWRHSWLDLTPWAGQDIVITFNMQQWDSYPILELDEVTVGSAFPDLWVELGNSQSAIPGQPMTYQIRYGNRGSVPASGVVITDILPAGMSFVSASVTPSSISPLTWIIAELAERSGPFAITVTVEIDPSIPLFSTLTHTLNISATTPEVETYNNTMQVAVWIGAKVYMPTISRK